MKALSFNLDGKRQQLLESKEITERILDSLPEPLAGELRTSLVDPDVQLGALLDQKKAELLDSIDPRYRFLLQRMSDFEDRQASLFDFTRDASGNGKLDLGVSAAAKLLLDRVTVEEDDTLATLALAPDAVLLRLGFSGKLGLAATFSASKGLLKAGLNFGTSTDQQFAYSLQVDKNLYALGALPRIKSNLCSPHELDELLAAMAKGELLRFERAGVSATNVGFEVGLSQELKNLFGKSAAATLGANLKLDYRDKAGMTLLLERQKGGAYFLQLKKTRKETNSSVLKLGVDLEFIGLGEQLIGRLTQVLPEDTDVSRALEKLDEITRTLSAESLQLTLQEMLKVNWPKAKPVFSHLLDEDSSRLLAENIRGELYARILSELDARINPWSEKTADAGKQVAAAISRLLGLEGRQKSQIEGYISEAVESALQDFQDKLDGRIDILLQTEDVQKLLKPWSFIGNEVSAALSDYSASSAASLAKVRALLKVVNDRYTAFRQGAIAVLKEDFEERIAVSIISKKQRDLSSSLALGVKFSIGNAALSRLYKALWNGSLDDLQTLIDDVRAAAPDAEFSGEYLTLVETSREFTFTVSLFGMRLKVSDMFQQNVVVRMDLNGALSLAKSGGKRNKSRTTRGETQSIEAHWSIDYLDPAVPDPLLLIKLALSDDKFRPGREIKPFFKLLEAGGLVRVGVGADLQSSLYQYGGNKPLADASLSLNIAWQRSDWLRLAGCGLAGEVIANVLVPSVLCDDFLVHARRIAPRCVANAEIFRAESRFPLLLDFLLDLGRRNDKSARAALGISSSNMVIPGQEFFDTYRLAKAIAGLHDGVRDLQVEWSVLVQLLPGKLHKLKPAQAPQLRDSLEKVNVSFGKAFGSVISTGLAFDDAGKLTWLTIAGLRLFQCNSSVSNDNLSCTFASERTGELLLS